MSTLQKLPRSYVDHGRRVWIKCGNCVCIKNVLENVDGKRKQCGRRT